MEIKNDLFNPLKYKGKIMAYTAQVGPYRIVYGTQYLKRSDLRELFDSYRFCFLKQVHGSKILKASVDKVMEADGHWTEKKYLALVVHTADCLPIFLMRDNIICSLHAGWRGVEKKIVLSALSSLPVLCHNDLGVSIGPHILKENFVVDEDVAKKLANSSSQGKNMVQKRKRGKYSVDLIGIVQDQIQSRMSVKNYYLFKVDTFSSNLFYSFRRTAEKKVGQINFIVRI